MWSSPAWRDRVVPLGMEVFTVNVDGLQFGVCDADLVGVGALIEAGVDLEPAAGRGRADQVDDRLQGGERLAAPVHGDEAEQAVLDSIPLAGAGREMADSELKAGLVCEFSQLELPWLRAVAVGAATVGGDL